jgi:hypothetical protein
MKVIKFIKAFFAAAALTTASVGPAFALPVQIVGPVTYNGSGCPVGTVPPPTITSGGGALTVLFNQFIAISNSGPNSYKTCNLVIPLQVPAGFKLNLYQAEYRGYVDPNTKGDLRGNYFFSPAPSGQGQGLTFPQTIVGGPNYYYVVHNFGSITNYLGTACGQNVNLRVNLSMRATGRGIATVDTSDLSQRGGITFPLLLDACI